MTERFCGKFHRQEAQEINQSMYLVTVPIGIGDMMYGLSAIDQIIKNIPSAFGRIDVLCTQKQAEIF